jgi:uncharacterized damage-inducible protein DinB
MNSLLQDLYGHQAWADAEHWGAIESHAPARGDQTLRNRLHHLHYVQRSFMWVVGDRAAPFVSSAPDDFATFEDLKAFARGSHAVINDLLLRLTDARSVEPVSIPWFRTPPLVVTVSEAMTQCAMHSQWHRGQNASRLRELGGAPPAVDLIVWYARGRPRPNWTGVGSGSVD